MKVEKVHEGIRYTLSNEGLKEGDEVYPVADGRQTENDGWIIHNFDFRGFASGFPDEPHIVKGFDSTPKEKTIRTNKGYSFSECYYKIIKCEKQVKVSDSMFGGFYEWVEIEKPIFPSPWICNQCNSEEYSGSVSEEDVQNLACSTCGGVEFHRNN
jgi:hypothetical protein